MKDQYLQYLRPIAGTLGAVILHKLIMDILVSKILNLSSYIDGLPFYMQLICSALFIGLGLVSINISAKITKGYSNIPPLMTGLFAGVYGAFATVIHEGAYFTSILILGACFYWGFRIAKRPEFNAGQVSQLDSSDSLSAILNFIHRPIAKTILGIIIACFGTFFSGYVLNIGFMLRFVLTGFGTGSQFWTMLSSFMLTFIPGVFSIYIGYKLIDEKYVKISKRVLLAFFLLIGPGNILIIGATKSMAWWFISNALMAFVAYKFSDFRKMVSYS